MCWYTCVHTGFEAKQMKLPETNEKRRAVSLRLAYRQRLPASTSPFFYSQMPENQAL